MFDDTDDPPFTLERIAIGGRILLRMFFRGKPVGWARNEQELDKRNTQYAEVQRRRQELIARLRGE